MKNGHGSQNEPCLSIPNTSFVKKNTRRDYLTQTGKLGVGLCVGVTWGIKTMTNALNDDLKDISKSNGLQTKDNFATVSSEKIKPESRNPGFDINTRDLPHKSAYDELLNNSIIAEVPNFYKQYGTTVENSGYFIIPRTVTSDPRYKSSRLKYQKVLHILFENVAFAPTTHSIGSEIINIEIGQFCVSVRRLMDLCNEGVKFKEDLVDKNIIERASHFWQRCGFVRQEVRHGKILLTITIPEFYERKKKVSETGSETKVRQNRDTKEEDKEDKEDNISSEKGSFEPSSFATSLLSDFYSSLFSSLPDFPKDNAKKTKTQYQAADRLLKKYSPEVIKAVISYAHTPGAFWIKFVHSVTYLEKKFVTLHEQMKNPLNKKPADNKPSKHNNPNFKPKIETPMAYNNKLSFNTEKNK